MSLHPASDSSVPDDTAAVARAVFPQGTACLRLRDRLGSIFTDEQFVSLFPKSGQPAECPWRLALVTLLQFSENLSNRRAADAVRSRIDWKYPLGLSLKDPGFDASVLSEFRSRLVKQGAESLLFERLLVLCREQGFLAQHGRQRTDSTHVLGAVRTLTRLACAIETLRTALDALAVAAPDWLRARADKAWAERYERRGGDVHIPKGEAARRAYAETVGRDGEALLSAVTGPGAPAWLREVPAVEILRRVWVQNFCRLDDDAGPSQPDKPQVLRWRTEVEGYPPFAMMVASPHDLDVHYAKKRQTTWIGYKVHLTETCESGQPNMITHVETTTAPVVDRDVLADVHAALKGKDLRPERHLVDAGYIDADGLVASARDHGITLVGPASGRQSVAGAHPRGLRHRAVRSRLGPPDRHLSGGPDERELDRRHQWRPRQRPHPVFPDPLQGLPAQGLGARARTGASLLYDAGRSTKPSSRPGPRPRTQP